MYVHDLAISECVSFLRLMMLTCMPIWAATYDVNMHAYMGLYHMHRNHEQLQQTP